MTDRYAVIGNPVAHSKSPQIHAAFARATGQDIAYERLLAPRDGFTAAVRAFAAAGGRGLNVTLPFKQEAFALAATLTERARIAGAVNTLRFDAGGPLGDNTDGVGVTRDLVHNVGATLRGADLLILGAGGATRGIVAPLLAEGPRTLTIANRTVDGRPSRSTAARSASVNRRHRPSSPPGGTPFAMAARFVSSSSSGVQ